MCCVCVYVCAVCVCVCVCVLCVCVCAVCVCVCCVCVCVCCVCVCAVCSCFNQTNSCKELVDTCTSTGHMYVLGCQLHIVQEMQLWPESSSSSISQAGQALAGRSTQLGLYILTALIHLTLLLLLLLQQLSLPGY